MWCIVEKSISLGFLFMKRLLKKMIIWNKDNKELGILLIFLK